MSHCTKLKINLENIGNNNNNNKEPVRCEKTLCEHIKIGKQGRAFLKWIHKNLLGQSLSIAGAVPAPPLLLPCCRVLPHLLALPHHTGTPLPHALVCQIHPIAPHTRNVVVLCVNLGVDLPCSQVRAWHRWGRTAPHSESLCHHKLLLKGEGQLFINFFAVLFVSFSISAHWYFSCFNKMYPRFWEQHASTFFSFSLNHPKNQQYQMLGSYHDQPAVTGDDGADRRERILFSQHHFYLTL